MQSGNDDFRSQLGDLEIKNLDGCGSNDMAHDMLFANKKSFSIDLAGRTLKVRVNEFARQAGAGVWVQYGDTVVLVSATCSAQPRPLDFLPLTVDFEERQYAAGRIPGNFFRREGRPTERAVLAARLTDRTLRPLFPDGFRHDVQVIALVLSVDGDNSPELCGMLGASLALTISDTPFSGPIAAIEIARVEGELIVNPNDEQSEASDLKLVVSGTRDAINMVEASAGEVPEEVVVEALKLAHQEIVRLCDWQLELRQQVGVDKRDIPLFTVDAGIDAWVRDRVTDALREAVAVHDKKEREQAMDRVEEECRAAFSELHADSGDLPGLLKQMAHAFKAVLKNAVRSMILDRGIRPDGRKHDEIRPINCQVGVVPRVHGSGLFTRGQTQVLCVATLGTVGDVQLIDSLDDEEFKRYIHHYNFPPFSVGETRMMRGPSRRDVGHGALASKAVETMLPDELDFPYTIRTVSEVLESNGSTSMASVCASTLALMDAGVPIKAPVAGMAMGLISEGDRVAVLSDIQGLEDFLGDMDFKVAGTARGITALQMDIKMLGVDSDVLSRALAQAREGRLFLLKRMLEALPGPRSDLSPLAPRITVLQIDPDRIRNVIGPGGKMINKIIQETGVKIDIEDDGRVFIASSDEEGSRQAIKMVEDLTRDIEVGTIYKGKITRLMNFGAFAEILPGKEGLVHISQLAESRVEKVEDVVSVGDELMVKVVEIDNLGRINLSHKAVLRESGGESGPASAESSEGKSGEQSGARQAPPRRRRRR